jgi:hypothetical protein
MPYKNPQDKTEYQREYMRKRRVRPPLDPVRPEPKVVRPDKPLLDDSINERLARSNRIKYGGKNAKRL